VKIRIDYADFPKSRTLVWNVTSSDYSDTTGCVHFASTELENMRANGRRSMFEFYMRKCYVAGRCDCSIVLAHVHNIIVRGQNSRNDGREGRKSHGTRRAQSKTARSRGSTLPARGAAPRPLTRSMGQGEAHRATQISNSLNPVTVTAARRIETAVNPSEAHLGMSVRGVREHVALAVLRNVQLNK
jgi:hypothetical protein